MHAQNTLFYKTNQKKAENTFFLRRLMPNVIGVASAFCVAKYKA